MKTIEFWVGRMALAFALSFTTSVAAQDAASEDGEGGTIVVTAPRIEGSVETDVPPDLVLDTEDIASYGASTVSDLLDLLATQTRTGRGREGGRPVVLVNGRRVSGFSEIRDLPSEAIQRVETFPEEVALRHGYAADQRVVNFILKKNLAAFTGEVEYGMPTNWSRSESELQATSLKIQDKGRINLSAQYDRDTAVLESERGIFQSAPGLAEARTLLGDREAISLNGVYNRMLSERIGATLNLKYDRADTASLFGLSGIDAPLKRDGLTQSGSAGLTVDGNVGRWRWTGTANYGVDASRTLTDQTIGAGRDMARSRLASGTIQLIASGSLAQLPAGPMTASLRVGYDRRKFRSSAIRDGIAQSSALNRGEASTRASLDIPLASRSRAVAEGLGDLSINLNAGFKRLNDFGGVRSFGYGLNWSPTRELNVIASLAAEEAAPTQQQLNDPLVFTPGVTIFDFVRGQSALVTQITGGNLFLRTEDRRDLKVGISYEPKTLEGLTISANYFRNRANNPLSSFPVLTPEIEAAFPNRIVRDSAGRLVSVDSRAINYLASASDELRIGLNFAKQVSGPSPGRGGFGSGSSRSLAAGPSGGTRIGGLGGGRFGGGAAKRVQAAIYYTKKLHDRIEIAPGVPALDLLDGSATGAFGGTSEHRIEIESGWFNNGLGVRLTGDWQSGSTIKSNPVTGSGTASDLKFSSLATVNLRLFLNFDQRKEIIEDVPFLKGSRLSFRINNLTNDVRTVRDASGVTPLRYQPGYIDPLGRTFEISFRKLF
jgi:iron complex outermembrane recepter protein